MNVRVLFPAAAMVGFLAGFTSLSVSGCGGDDCRVGSESCACTAGGACDPGLSCASMRCVKLGGSTGSAGSTGSMMGSGGSTGGGGQSGGGDLAQFTGTWKYVTGQSTVDCGAAGKDTSMVTGTFKLQKGVDSPLVEIEGTCTYKLDYSGNTATFRQGSMCMEVANGSSVTLIVNSGTMMVNGGTNATINIGGNVTLVKNGQTFPCSYTATATAMKISPE
jgi:hypothetical protein